MIFKKWSRIFSDYSFGNFIDELFHGITKLNFKDNFESYTVEDLELTAATASILAHGLGKIPSGRVIIKQSANATFIDSDWTKDNVSITASADCTISLVYYL